MSSVSAHHHCRPLPFISASFCFPFFLTNKKKDTFKQSHKKGGGLEKWLIISHLVPCSQHRSYIFYCDKNYKLLYQHTTLTFFVKYVLNIDVSEIKCFLFDQSFCDRLTANFLKLLVLYTSTKCQV